MTFDAEKHLIKLKGKDYLPVYARIAAFRDKCPHGSITTMCEKLDTDKNLAIFRARIEDGQGGVAEGHGSETARDFPDYYEKAETKAIGRALAALGYGTVFARELDEGERVVDTPTPQPEKKPTKLKVVNNNTNGTASATDEDQEQAQDQRAIEEDLKTRRVRMRQLMNDGADAGQWKYEDFVGMANRVSILLDRKLQPADLIQLQPEDIAKIIDVIRNPEKARF